MINSTSASNISQDLQARLRGELDRVKDTHIPELKKPGNHLIPANNNHNYITQSSNRYII